MKAALINAYGGTDGLTVREVEKPSPAGGQFLVRVRAAAVNPKDTFIRKGRFRRFTGRRFPLATGFDFAGELAEVSDQVTHLHVGDEVYGMLDGWHGGTCAEYVTVHAHQLALKPASLSFQAAAALPLVSLTALQALRDLGGIAAGSEVCINGASGGVGSMAVQLAKIYGATVTAYARSENHPFLKELGADHCFDYRQDDAGRGPARFDIFFDVFGNQRFRDAREALRPGGVWISTVLQPHVFLSIALTRFFGRRKAKFVRVKANPQDLIRVGCWAEAGRLRPCVHHVYPLEEIAAAHRQQETKHTRGKIVISID